MCSLAITVFVIVSHTLHHKWQEVPKPCAVLGPLEEVSPGSREIEARQKITTIWGKKATDQCSAKKHI